MAEGDVELGPVDNIIEQTVQLLLNYDEELQDRSKHHPKSIYMVPSVHRDLSPRSYTPQVVSIGPLHHQDEHLKGFEVQKTTYMHNLFHNILPPCGSTPEQTIKACVTKVSGSIDRIKACYIGMKTYPDIELVKMMVLDACFILAFIYDRSISDSPLGQTELLFPHIYLDMFLIENQIPFFVLQDIYKYTISKLHPTLPLTKFILHIQEICCIFKDIKISPILPESTRPDQHPNLMTRFLIGSCCGSLFKNSKLDSTQSDEADNPINQPKEPDNPINQPNEPDNPINQPNNNPNHILGFLHEYYHNPKRDSSRGHKLVKAHSVVELDRSGVRFSNYLDRKWPMAMELELSSFLCFPISWSKPTLKMPILHLSDYSELLIRNLIIYEYSSKVQTCVSSYMIALDKLIDTPEDVAMLVRSQVFDNYLGSNEAAADIINFLCKEVLIKDFYYYDEWQKMDDYYNAYWPNLIAELRRKYFSNPWSLIALFAGIALFVLTVVQTIYSVKAVKESKTA